MSLTEIVVALVIAAFIIIFGFSYYVAQSGAFNAQDQVSQAQGEARLAFNKPVNVGDDITWVAPQAQWLPGYGLVSMTL